MIYLVEKRFRKLYGVFDNISYAKEYLADNKLNINNFYILTEQGMKYVNRIAYIDGKCVYNNVEFWSQDLSDIVNNYENHTIESFLDASPTKGKEVITKARFISEYNNMLNKIHSIDGIPGEIEYNIGVGNEFIALFREECILTEFTKDSDTTPMAISEKLYPVIGLIQTGSFREARLLLSQLIQKPGFLDDFLTLKRMNKYIEMLGAADAISYATSEDYFYTIPNENG